MEKNLLLGKEVGAKLAPKYEQLLVYLSIYLLLYLSEQKCTCTLICKKNK